MAGVIRSFNPTGMSLGELEHWAKSGRVSPTIQTMLDAKIAGMKASAPPAAKPAGVSPATQAQQAPNLDNIRAKLQGASDKWVAGQNANIDRQGEQSLAQGMSNMIGSGLAGTTVVGGMTAGVGESVTRAKGDVAGQAAQRLEDQTLQYAGLAQSASESAAGRDLQRSEGALNRASSEKMGAMSLSSGGGQATRRPSIQPGLDAFGQPMAGSVQQKTAAANSVNDLRAFNIQKKKLGVDAANANQGSDPGSAPILFKPYSFGNG